MELIKKESKKKMLNKVECQSEEYSYNNNY